MPLKASGGTMGHPLLVYPMQRGEGVALTFQAGTPAGGTRMLTEWLEGGAVPPLPCVVWGHRGDVQHLTSKVQTLGAALSSAEPS